MGYMSFSASVGRPFTQFIPAGDFHRASENIFIAVGDGTDMTTVSGVHAALRFPNNIDRRSGVEVSIPNIRGISKCEVSKLFILVEGVTVGSERAAGDAQVGISARGVKSGDTIGSYETAGLADSFPSTGAVAIPAAPVFQVGAPEIRDDVIERDPASAVSATLDGSDRYVFISVRRNSTDALDTWETNLFLLGLLVIWS